MSIEVWIAIGLLLLAALIITWINSRDRIKGMNFFLEEEIPALRALGLEAFIGIDSRKYVVFYHPMFMYKTAASMMSGSYNASHYYADYSNVVQYNFNSGAAQFISGSEDSLSDLLTLQNLYFYKRVKAIKNKTLNFMQENNIEAELSKVTPLILIFGNNPELIKQALASNVHPAILAEIIVANKLNINELNSFLEEAKSYGELPISWVADIYDFKYDKR